MVAATEQGQVGQRGGAALRPVADMMDFSTACAAPQRTIEQRMRNFRRI
jgi:hypothetical protein